MSITNSLRILGLAAALIVPVLAGTASAAPAGQSPVTYLEQSGATGGGGQHS